MNSRAFPGSANGKREWNLELSFFAISIRISIRIRNRIRIRMRISLPDFHMNPTSCLNEQNVDNM